MPTSTTCISKFGAIRHQEMPSISASKVPSVLPAFPAQKRTPASNLSPAGESGGDPLKLLGQRSPKPLENSPETQIHSRPLRRNLKKLERWPGGPHIRRGSFEPSNGSVCSTDQNSTSKHSERSTCAKGPPLELATVKMRSTKFRIRPTTPRLFFRGNRLPV
jgi:hypothetical protein